MYTWPGSENFTVTAAGQSDFRMHPISRDVQSEKKENNKHGTWQINTINLINARKIV